MIAEVTALARLRKGEDAEKTVTFKRRPGGEVVIDTLQVPGTQGGRIEGITSDTVALAHVHFSGLERSPGKGDHSSVKIASVPSFVIIAETGTVWEVGRKNGEYVQRTLDRSGKIGRWQPFSGQ